ncbi:hypothetical protein TRFO_15886 [Tritrichomonas foetus]|uniref:Uncharacterized protein n=1 Tax=Tritrichomonas foetus TaxID=1144522 RepID=A0A1J4KRZ1_9EUKA|nr:hypothetical protein TRFO_15886 [Tritrichomonas foetus]|eukprot:OHT13866.1 hypothetical protein TRFO_15886 [Tritrichomonas foetus]
MDENKTRPEEEEENYSDDDSNNDDEIAFLQTQKALIEAIDEQKILKEKLTTLEARNRPAKWGKPVIIQKFDAHRGNVDPDAELSPEQLIQELKTAQHMLENAKRASDTARAERKDLENEINQLIITSQQETDSLLQSNAAHHKSDLMTEQLQFRQQQSSWSSEKSELLSEAEHLSMISHDALHKSSEAREYVDNQRKKIQSLAAELRHDLTKSKELRDKLDDAKTKVTLIPNLLMEIDMNKNSADSMNKNISEQKQILKAVRVSKQAQEVLDDIAKQTEELAFAKKDSERTLENTQKELVTLKEKEKIIKKELEIAQEDFKNEQMKVFVMEAELRDLRSEFQRMKAMVIEEGRKNVELHKTLREQKMDATMRFWLDHSNEIHKAEKVHSSLMNVREQLLSRNTSTLPPLKPVVKVPKSSLR